MSLDSIRKVHAQTVDSLMMELSHIVQALTHSEEQYRTMEVQLQADTEAYAQQARQGLTIEDLLQWEARMDAQRSALQHVRAGIDHATGLWQQTQERLVEARRECKLLERVAERRQSAVRAAHARREQWATDEAASRQVSVRSRGDS
ncbi:MAG TPA: flagellar export protein FliJ [Nitrospira sp.]|nr:flagellar export protein FliJ [Nitrospira sp.]